MEESRVLLSKPRKDEEGLWSTGKHQELGGSTEGPLVKARSTALLTPAPKLCEETFLLQVSKFVILAYGAAES